MSVALPDRPPAWRLFVPKLVMVLRQKYGRFEFGSDLIADITVAIVALPLSMVLAIAAGTTPDRDWSPPLSRGSWYRRSAAVVVVVVLGVIAKHGYDGLILIGPDADSTPEEIVSATRSVD